MASLAEHSTKNCLTKAPQLEGRMTETYFTALTIYESNACSQVLPGSNMTISLVKYFFTSKQVGITGWWHAKTTTAIKPLS